MENLIKIAVSLNTMISWHFELSAQFHCKVLSLNFLIVFFSIFFIEHVAVKIIRLRGT